jgi:hypothetical protein
MNMKDDLCMMIIMRFSDMAPITIPPFREHGRATFKLHFLGTSSLPSSDIGVHNKFPHVVAVLAHGNVGQHLVERLDLFSAACFLHDTPVFTQAPEIEGMSHRGQNDERRFARAWR